MNLNDVHVLIAYDEWANRRVFAVIAGLSSESFSAARVSSFASVQATLAHIIGAEWIWLRRWLGESPGAPPSWTKDATPATLRAELDVIERERAAFLSRLTDANLADYVEYRNLKGEPGRLPLGDLFVHVVNHSTYHRGQITTLVREAGGTPVSTDYHAFRLETRG